VARADFRAFRADGFPLCPRCEEDELASLVMLAWDPLKDPEPPLAEVLAGEFFCYACHWHYDRFVAYIERPRPRLTQTIRAERYL
jgi:hypothetical protein